MAERVGDWCRRRWHFTAWAIAGAAGWVAFECGSVDAAVSIYGRSLPDEPVPYVVDELPPQAKPLVIFGDPFLEVGNIEPGWELPTGAVWRPSLWVFGTYRTALQSFDRGDRKPITEWANSLDLFANLQLTGTERLLLGINPLRQGVNYTGYTLGPDSERGSFESFNGNVRTLFFEGDFGELFPDLDRDDSGTLDYGFAVGRQAISYQQGILIDDTALDSIGIVRNSLTVPGGANLRVSGLYGWGEVSRGDSDVDSNAQLFGLFNEADFYKSTVALDAIYVASDDNGGDAAYLGLSAVQRFGLWTSSFRFMTSQAFDGDTRAAKDGYLLFADVSTTPLGTDNILYATAFAALDEFTMAARDPQVGGPLGRAGILFASQRLGRFGSALSNRAKDVIGFSVGHQWFLVPNNREQLVLEFGARKSADGSDSDAFALGGRYQLQIHNQAFWQLDLFGSMTETEGAGFGARTEIQVKF